MNLKLNDLTGQVIKSFYKVYSILGYGFLERVYQNALFLELNSQGLVVEMQKPITVFYQEQEVGVYYADMVINELLIVELKATETLIKVHEFQLINYLKASEIEIGLLLNFGKNPEISRKIYSNYLNKSNTQYS